MSNLNVQQKVALLAQKSKETKAKTRELTGEEAKKVEYEEDILPNLTNEEKDLIQKYLVKLEPLGSYKEPDVYQFLKKYDWNEKVIESMATDMLKKKEEAGNFEGWTEVKIPDKTQSQKSEKEPKDAQKKKKFQKNYEQRENEGRKPHEAGEEQRAFRKREPNVNKEQEYAENDKFQGGYQEYNYREQKPRGPKRFPGQNRSPQGVYYVKKGENQGQGLGKRVEYVKKSQEGTEQAPHDATEEKKEVQTHENVETAAISPSKEHEHHDKKHGHKQTHHQDTTQHHHNHPVSHPHLHDHSQKKEEVKHEEKPKAQAVAPETGAKTTPEVTSTPAKESEPVTRHPPAQETPQKTEKPLGSSLEVSGQKAPVHSTLTTHEVKKTPDTVHVSLTRKNSRFGSEQPHHGHPHVQPVQAPSHHQTSAPVTNSTQPLTALHHQQQQQQQHHQPQGQHQQQGQTGAGISAKDLHHPILPCPYIVFPQANGTCIIQPLPQMMMHQMMPMPVVTSDKDQGKPLQPGQPGQPGPSFYPPVVGLQSFQGYSPLQGNQDNKNGQPLAQPPTYPYGFMFPQGNMPTAQAFPGQGTAPFGYGNEGLFQPKH